MGKLNLRKPTWLLGATEIERRRFHNINIEVFVGDVSIDSIEGWMGNPRTELQAEHFTERHGRPPTNEEMYEIVLADNDPKEGLKIKELSGSIFKNGVRVPIVLNHERRLLDGNRRYYACMFLSKEASPKEDRKRFQSIPAMVLPKGTTKEVEHAIITEFNFADDYREEWPYYVKATRVYADHVAGLDKEELEQKYALPWRILNTWIRAAGLCEKFLAYHNQNFLARHFAYRHFIMFDEMMRRYKSRLDQADFRDSVFDLLIAEYPDNHRFKSSADVIRLPEMRDNPESWDTLTSKKGPEALKSALRILEVSMFDNVADVNSRFKRVVKSLEKLVSTGVLSAVDDNLLEEFHGQAEGVPGSPQEPAAQVERMIEWLDDMTSLQIASLGAGTLTNLRKALERVLKMAESVDRQPTKRTVNQRSKRR
jgi:ParB-like nuclease domain